MPSITNKLKEKWQLIVYISVVLGAFSFFISTLMPFYFRSEMAVLIIPQIQAGSQAPSRSVSYQSEILSKIIYSDVFMKKVAQTPWVLEDDFPFDDEKRIEFWKKRVAIEKKGDLGILKIFVFERSREGSENLALGIKEALLKEGEEYFSKSNGVEIRVIGEPIISSQPVKPNIFLNAFLGFWVGLLGSIFLVFIFDDFDLKVFERRAVLASKEQDKIKKRLQRELEYSKRKESLPSKESLEDDYFVFFSKVPEKDQLIPAKNQNLEQEAKKEEGGKGKIEDGKRKDKSTDETEKGKAADQSAVEEQKAIGPKKKIPTFKPVDFIEFEQEQKRTEKEKSQKTMEAENEKEEEAIFSGSYQSKEGAHYPKIGEAVFTKETAKKAMAPENLPIFMEEGENDFESGKEASQKKFQEKYQKSGSLSPKAARNDFSGEKDQAVLGLAEKEEANVAEDVTEEEVKEKLNKLLRGEL